MFPVGVAAVQEYSCVSSVVGRPCFCSVEGCLSGVCSGVSVVSAGGVYVGDVSGAESGHFDCVGWVASESPSGFGVHCLFEEVAACGGVGYSVGEHYELEVFGCPVAWVVGCASGWTAGVVADVVAVGVVVDACFEVVVVGGEVSFARGGDVGCRAPELAVGCALGVVAEEWCCGVVDV